MRFFLFIQREMELFIYTREKCPQPPLLLLFPSCLHDLGGWHALSSKRQEQRIGGVTEGYGSSLKYYGGLSISSVSHERENKVGVESDTQFQSRQRTVHLHKEVRTQTSKSWISRMWLFCQNLQTFQYNMCEDQSFLQLIELFPDFVWFDFTCIYH